MTATTQFARTQHDTAGVKARSWKAITDQWRPPVTNPHPDDLRRLNQQRIDALRGQVIVRDDEDYRLGNDEQLNEDTAFHFDLGN